MPVEWMLPAATEAAKELIKHRDVAISTWDAAVAKFLGPKSQIAFVGPEGIGKTVLLDQLTGRVMAPGYERPAKSRKSEHGYAKSLGNRLALVVAPGAGGPRFDTYAKIFDAKSPLMAWSLSLDRVSSRCGIRTKSGQI